MPNLATKSISTPEQNVVGGERKVFSTQAKGLYNSTRTANISSKADNRLFFGIESLKNANDTNNLLTHSVRKTSESEGEKIERLR